MRASPQDGFLILFLRVFLGKWSVDSQRLARQLLRGYCSKRPDLLRGYCSKRGQLLRGYCSRLRPPARGVVTGGLRQSFSVFTGVLWQDGPRGALPLFLPAPSLSAALPPATRPPCRVLFLQGYCGRPPHLLLRGVCGRFDSALDILLRGYCSRLQSRRGHSAGLVLLAPALITFSCPRPPPATCARLLGKGPAAIGGFPRGSPCL